jgi:hypothetical protein
MSSVVRELAQIDARTRFFVCVGATTTVEYVPNGSGSFNAIMTAAAFDTATDNSTYANGTLLKDMGQAVTVVAANGQHLAKFRLVQEMDSATDEGVPIPACSYVCTWTADSISGTYAVTVVRAG